MIVYKAMRRGRGSKPLASVYAVGKAKKHYVPGTIHRAPGWLARWGYLITAFDSFWYAKDFAHNSDSGGGLEVWECEATGVTQRMPDRCRLDDLSSGVLVGAYQWPDHTVMCKTIKLLKEVT